MPRSPPLHNAQRVEVNRKENQKEYNQKKRTGQDFYNSGRWRKLRNWYIKTNPLCVDCKKQNHIKLADVVDHIIPIKDGGAQLDSQNLQGLCHLHHNQKSAKEQGEKIDE